MIYFFCYVVKGKQNNRITGRSPVVKGLNKFAFLSTRAFLAELAEATF